ncbi:MULTISPECIES: hypothetical protein [unclassified Roseofilum]|uniref:hypothetical protein n=1 Tax=unclassified Roseofilum TaxID=2620099 RepID=UPI000E9F40E2|nr:MULTISPECIES: hypothetical protein [unclassified Roseofilum]MBP0008361.1 hypothetical protein [Roseofilum sp. Belize Diploria]MBP0034220.1 hypothetical protein [Roseofilum sp. Belize BBD 4]HBQ98317.1 hypothetical protein [Cyanobacteria bacterium UBA11691]
MLETLLSLWLIFGENSQGDPIISEQSQPVELQSQNKAENKNGERWYKERRNCRSLGNNRDKCEIDLTGTGMETLNQAYENKGIQNISTETCSKGVFSGAYERQFQSIDPNIRFMFTTTCKLNFTPDYRDDKLVVNAYQRIDQKWYRLFHYFRVILDNQEENPDKFLYFVVSHTYDDDDRGRHKYNGAFEVFLVTRDNFRVTRDNFRIIKPGFPVTTLHNPVRISRTVPFLNDHPDGIALWLKKLRWYGPTSEYKHPNGLGFGFFLLALDSLSIALEAQKDDNMEIIDMSFDPEIAEHIYDGRVDYRYIKKYVLSVEFIKR